MTLRGEKGKTPGSFWCPSPTLGMNWLRTRKSFTSLYSTQAKGLSYSSRTISRKLQKNNFVYVCWSLIYNLYQSVYFYQNRSKMALLRISWKTGKHRTSYKFENIGGFSHLRSFSKIWSVEEASLEWLKGFFGDIRNKL